MRTPITLVAYFIAGFLLTATALHLIQNTSIPAPAQELHQAAGECAPTATPAQPPAPASHPEAITINNDLPIISPDSVKEEILAKQQKVEEAMKASVELLRRGADITEWKTFCASHGLYLHAADIDPASDTYEVALTTRELPLILDKSRPLLAITSDDVREAGYMILCRRKGRLWTAYKAYMSTSIGIGKFLQ